MFRMRVVSEIFFSRLTLSSKTFSKSTFSKSTFSKTAFSRKASYTHAISGRVLSAAMCGAVMLTAPSLRTALAQGDHRQEHALKEDNAGREERPVQARFVDPADEPPPPARAARLAGRYFVDFRSRTAATYGHAFIWYGRLNAQGGIGLVNVAGLHPASDNPIPYIIGHVFPVPSETGKSYGDLDDQYLTANYRVYLSEADAKKVFAYIRFKQESSPLWLAGVYNCTAFLADIASYMGLKTPVTATWMYPEDMVKSLKELNGGREEISLAANHQNAFGFLTDALGGPSPN